MRAYPTKKFQTRYTKHNFLFGFSERQTRVVHITVSRFGIMTLTLLHFWILYQVSMWHQ